MTTNKEIEPVLIFAGTNWEAGVVKSLLENAEIEAFLKDELMGMLEPWVSAAGGAGAVKVFVSSSDFELASEIVNEFVKNSMESDE